MLKFFQSLLPPDQNAKEAQEILAQFDALIKETTDTFNRYSSRLGNATKDKIRLTDRQTELKNSPLMHTLTYKDAAEADQADRIVKELGEIAKQLKEVETRITAQEQKQKPTAEKLHAWTGLQVDYKNKPSQQLLERIRAVLYEAKPGLKPIPEVVKAPAPTETPRLPVVIPSAVQEIRLRNNAVAMQQQNSANPNQVILSLEKEALERNKAESSVYEIVKKIVDDPNFKNQFYCRAKTDENIKAVLTALHKLKPDFKAENIHITRTNNPQVFTPDQVSTVWQDVKEDAAAAEWVGLPKRSPSP